MSTSIWLIVTLTFWLLITIARQVFDLIGKLWIPVGFNLLQILCCITGLFGVCQKRIFLLIALTISTVISICQNVLVFLWYIGIFGDISRPVLSGGLPYSYSFFLRHTPYCGAHFDLQKSRWVQSPCVLPYNQIEAGQALLHVILAAITMILSIIVILERRREKDRPKMPLPAQYAQIKRHHRPAVTSSFNDIRSGYTNSSYDDIHTVVLPEHRIVPQYPYERHIRNKRARIRPNSMPQPHFDQYSSVKSIDKDDIQSQPHTPRSSTTANGRFRKSSEQPRRASMHEELRCHDGPNEEEFGRTSGTMTSLVSFDPKSRTLLRVREHRESDDDEAEGYSRIGKQMSVDSGLYERIRDRGTTRSRELLNSVAPRTIGESRISQDSVPSFAAPTFHHEESQHDVIVHEVSSSDSGFPGSNGSDWPAASSPPRPGRWQTDPAPSWQMAKRSMISSSPGITLVPDEDQFSSGTAIDSPQYKSNFRVEIEAKDKSLAAVGHYHSINEFQLTDDPSSSPTQTMPVITGAGLLV